MSLTSAADRKPTVREALDINLLPAEGLSFDEALEEEYLETWIGSDLAQEGEYKITGPGRAKLTVQPMGDVDEGPPILIRGSISASLCTPCVRCLSPVSLELETQLETTLFAATPPETQENKRNVKKRKPDELEPWNETFPDPDALDDTTYVGTTIDLPSILRESLLLEVSMNPTCVDEAGCSTRTEALLEEANRPVREAGLEGDPRWAALRQIAQETEES